MFNYALSVALLHRPDTKNVDVPAFIASFPDKFVDGTILQKVKEEAEIIPEGSRVRIIIIFLVIIKLYRIYFKIEEVRSQGVQV